jgi:FixJ family two-component response regulator
MKPSPPPTLLIVDDEPAVRNVLSQVGESAGFRVVTCAGGREALDRTLRYREHRTAAEARGLSLSGRAAGSLHGGDSDRIV